MKKSILFVDDDPMVLQGLQRMLRPLRNDWDMTFVDGGDAALKAMAITPFDVVVSDMRMPGMNGAQLLNEVMARYPKTVRIILSGHADHDLVMQAVGSTHQYLAKPCDSETLKSTIQQATALGESLESEKIKQLVGRMRQLPSLPSLYVEVVEELQSEDASLEKVGEIISKDIAMTAQILKLVNSAFFGLRRHVVNTVDAVNYLGLDTIRSLVLAMNLFSQFRGPNIEGFSFESLWAHSMTTGGFARAIAQAERADQKVTDEAFMGGLLHDMGKLMLSANFPEEFKQVVVLAREKNLQFWEAEKEVFGVTHCTVGAYLLSLWGLPSTVVEAVALHHDPARGATPGFCALTAVHAANVIVHEQQPDSLFSAPPVFDTDYLGKIIPLDRLDVWRNAGSQIILEGTDQ